MGFDFALPEINGYRDHFRQTRGREAPPFIICDFISLPSHGTYVTLGEMTEAAGGHGKACKDYIRANLIGMPHEMAYEQMKRFADRILPKLEG